MNFLSMLLAAAIALCHIIPTQSFVPPRSSCISRPAPHRKFPTKHPSNASSITKTLAPSRPSTSTALSSLFGLGPAELIIIAFAGLLVIGPSKLMEMSRAAGRTAGEVASTAKDKASDLGEGKGLEEWKNIPEEFKKGVEEGEIEARGRKAKTMGEVGEE